MSVGSVGKGKHAVSYSAQKRERRMNGLSNTANILWENLHLLKSIRGNPVSTVTKTKVKHAFAPSEGLIVFQSLCDFNYG